MHVFQSHILFSPSTTEKVQTNIKQGKLTISNALAHDKFCFVFNIFNTFVHCSYIWGDESNKQYYIEIIILMMLIFMVIAYVATYCTVSVSSSLTERLDSSV